MKSMQVLTRCHEIFAAVTLLRREGKTVGLVPTMGALHAGHLSLVEVSRRDCDMTVVTIFVNPTQFGPHEDFTRYPRDLDADLEKLRPLGVDLVFAPPLAEMYPPGETTRVDPGCIAEPLEGQFRPGHFRGVATIVLKLFNAIPANVAYFGQKDYQQTLVVRRMAADLNVPVRIAVCPTIRESDGLALSSRNVYLSSDERLRALVLSQSLILADRLVAEGEHDAATILAQMRELFARAGVDRIDYIALADPETLAPAAEIRGRTLTAIAAHIGKTRLIDNRLIG
jgi:pantoate--beta-alanine ligase